MGRLPFWTSGGNNNAPIVNSRQPEHLRGVSDFDMTHEINANYHGDIPVGRSRRFARSSNRVLDAVSGGWQLNRIVRRTSGLPFAVDTGSRWPSTHLDKQSSFGYAGSALTHKRVMQVAVRLGF